MHFVRADLDLHRLGAGSDDRGVNRAVEIVLRRRDVVVELAGNELPQRVNDAERRIAFGDGIDQHPRGADVHELLEGQLLGLHLAPDAVDVFRPSFDVRLRCRRCAARPAAAPSVRPCSVRARSAAPSGPRRCACTRPAEDIGTPDPPVPTSPATRPGDWRAARRLRGSRWPICAAVPDPTDFAERIFCNCSASRTTTRRTSPMTASSILRSASACAASRPRSGVQSGGRPNRPNWLKARASRAASAPKRFSAASRVREFLVEQRLQHGGDHHVVVGIESAHDLGHLERGLRARPRPAAGRSSARTAAKLACSRLARGAGWCSGFHF